MGMSVLQPVTAVCVAVAAGCWLGSAFAAPPAPKSLRLYVLDCGRINVNRAGTERYNVTPEEVGETRFSVPCFLISHPRGTLMWDLGVVPDDTVEARARGQQGNPTATPDRKSTRLNSSH